MDVTCQEIEENVGITEENTHQMQVSQVEPKENPTGEVEERDGSLSRQDNCNYLETLFNLNKENKELKAKIKSLEDSLLHLEAEKNSENALQVESAEKTIQQQALEIERLQDNVRQLTEVADKKFQQLKDEFDVKFDRLTKALEQASKERDAMVMKYAVSENSVITLQRTQKQLELKIKEHLKEKESLNGKISVAQDEKVKLAQVIDTKNNDILTLEREVNKKKDELHAQSSNLKFFQNKLKLELESHKETQSKLEKTVLKLKEAREETEQVRKDGQAIVHQYETEGRKVLEMQDSAEVCALQRQLEECKLKNSQLVSENNRLLQMVQNLEAERLSFDAAQYQYELNNVQHQQNALDLEAARTELNSTQILLAREQQRLRGCEEDIERLKQACTDAEQEMRKCREREAELLAFTQMLTEKNVCLQSGLSGVEGRLELLTVDSAADKVELENTRAEIRSVTSQLELERRQRNEENEMLNRHLNEKSETCEKLATQQQDIIGEMQLLKKKHLASVKELTRELHALRKKLATETSNLGQGSHTSSNTSLNILEPSESPLPPLTQPLPTSVEPDRQLLIEKLVKVQRSNARKQEKMEFLEEHCRQLMMELQKKTKIVQSLIMKQQPSALVSESMDDNKMALSKHGGIMASVYSSKPVDDSITLQLSLEINTKLQAVLEDTLLKNITLKENIETLGNEIARLSSLHVK